MRQALSFATFLSSTVFFMAFIFVELTGCISVQRYEDCLDSVEAILTKAGASNLKGIAFHDGGMGFAYKKNQQMHFVEFASDRVLKHMVHEGGTFTEYPSCQYENEVFQLRTVSVFAKEEIF